MIWLWLDGLLLVEKGAYANSSIMSVWAIDLFLSAVEVSVSFAGGGSPLRVRRTMMLVVKGRSTQFQQPEYITEITWREWINSK